MLPSPVVMEAPVTPDVVALAPNATLPVFSSVVAVVPNTLSLGIADPALPVATSMSISPIQSYNRGNVMIKTLHRASSQAEVTQVIANIRSTLHGYAVVEYIEPLFVIEFERMLALLYQRDIAKYLECRNWRDWDAEHFISH